MEELLADDRRGIFWNRESMVVEMVPLKGGLGGIFDPPIGRKNTSYIPLIVLAEPGG